MMYLFRSPLDCPQRLRTLTKKFGRQNKESVQAYLCNASSIFNAIEVHLEFDKKRRAFALL